MCFAKTWLVAVVAVSMCPIWADAALAEGVLEGEVVVTGCSLLGFVALALSSL